MNDICKKTYSLCLCFKENMYNAQFSPLLRVRLMWQHKHKLNQTPKCRLFTNSFN